MYLKLTRMPVGVRGAYIVGVGIVWAIRYNIRVFVVETGENIVSPLRLMLP